MEFEEKNYFPTTEELLLRFPLYDQTPVNDVNWDSAEELKFFDGVLDTYCIKCKQKSTFKGIPPRGRTYVMSGILRDHSFIVSLACTRNQEHVISFFFRVFDGNLIKVGQHPAAADFQFPELRKYSKVLGADKFREFSKGVGLVSHGVGIGAFVYLRRIFEGLIEDAHQESITSEGEGWDEEEYGRSRMDQKITLLKSRLPEFLVVVREGEMG